MKRADTLAAAGKAVADRGLNYGSPEDNFERIARRWNVCLENIGYGVRRETVYGMLPRRLTAADVASMMIDVKLARLENSPDHADSWIDIAGYAACGAEVSIAGEPAHIEHPRGSFHSHDQVSRERDALPKMQEQPYSFYRNTIEDCKR